MSVIENSALEVFNFLNRMNNPVKADVILIVGDSDLSLVNKAVNLFHSKLAPKICFVSVGDGKAKGDKDADAKIKRHEKWRQIILSEGVSHQDLYSQGLMLDLNSEVAATIPFLKNHEVRPERVILVSSPIRQLRVHLSFLQQFPSICYINCPTHTHVDLANREIHKLLIREIKLLREGYRGGVNPDLANPLIPRHVNLATTLLQMDIED